MYLYRLHLPKCYIYTLNSNQCAAMNIVVGPSVFLCLLRRSGPFLQLRGYQALKPACWTSATVKRRLNGQSFLGEDDLQSIISIMTSCCPQAQTVSLKLLTTATTCAVCASLLELYPQYCRNPLLKHYGRDSKFRNRLLRRRTSDVSTACWGQDPIWRKN